MTDAGRLVARAAACGFDVRLRADGTPYLHPVRAEAFLTPALRADLTAARDAVIVHLAAGPEPWVCEACRAAVYVTEAEWRGVAGWACPRDGVWESGAGGGPPRVVEDRCPYKPEVRR